MFGNMLSVAYKEFRLWLQTPANWLVVFLVPFAFIGIFGVTFLEGTPVVTVYGVNEDQGELGEEIITLLQKSDNLELEMLTTQDEADALVTKGTRMAAIVIPANFSGSVTTDDGATILVLIDPGKADQAGIVTGLVQEALIKPIVYAEIERAMSGLFKGKSVEGVDSDLFKTFVNAGIKAVVAKSVNEAIDDPLIKIEAKPYSEEASQGKISIFSQLAPGVAMAFAFFMVSHLADAVMDERSVGTLRRLMSTPMSKISLLFGKALPSFLLAVVQMIFVLLVCNQFFNLPLGNSWLALMTIIVATALCVAGLGILIAGLARTPTQSGAVATFIVLAMAVVSGAIIPALKLAGIGYVTPHYWALEGIQNVIARGMGMDGVLMQSGILLGMAVLFFIVGAWRFKYE
ncbi:MAG TPA: ABC transporter permease [Anaerolineales bacterium]|nr:ABC transporter permease [Anaerolineales bacterium]